MSRQLLSMTLLTSFIHVEDLLHLRNHHLPKNEFTHKHIQGRQKLLDLSVIYSTDSWANYHRWTVPSHIRPMWLWITPMNYRKKSSKSCCTSLLYYGSWYGLTHLKIWMRWISHPYDAPDQRVLVHVCHTPHQRKNSSLHQEIEASDKKIWAWYDTNKLRTMSYII